MQRLERESEKRAGLLSETHIIPGISIILYKYLGSKICNHKRREEEEVSCHKVWPRMPWHFSTKSGKIVKLPRMSIKKREATHAWCLWNVVLEAHVTNTLDCTNESILSAFKIKTRLSSSSTILREKVAKAQNAKSLLRMLKARPITSFLTKKKADHQGDGPTN